MGVRELSVEDVGEMKRFEHTFVQWIKPWQVKVSPMMAAIVLVRCARTVLRTCHADDQKQLLPVLTAFLEGKVNEPGTGGTQIITPDQFAAQRSRR